MTPDFIMPTVIYVPHNEPLILRRIGLTPSSAKAILGIVRNAHLHDHHPTVPRPASNRVLKYAPTISAWFMAQHMLLKLREEQSSYVLYNRHEKKTCGYILLRPEKRGNRLTYCDPSIDFSFFNNSAPLCSASTKAAERTEVLASIVGLTLKAAFANKAVLQIKTFMHKDDAKTGRILSAFHFRRDGTPDRHPHIYGTKLGDFQRHVLYRSKAEALDLA